LLWAYGPLTAGGDDISYHGDGRGVVEINFVPDLPPPAVPPSLGTPGGVKFYLIHAGLMIGALYVSSTLVQFICLTSWADQDAP